jgi:hypothetical protein
MTSDRIGIAGNLNFPGKSMDFNRFALLSAGLIVLAGTAV